MNRTRSAEAVTVALGVGVAVFMLAKWMRGNWPSDAGEFPPAPVAVGFASVQVVGANMEFPETATDPAGPWRRDREPAFAVRLKIHNHSSERKLDYRGLSYAATGDVPQGFATDDLGNRYRQIVFVKVVGKNVRGRESLYPGQAFEDVIYFEPPVKAATAFSVKLQASRVAPVRSGNLVLSFNIAKARGQAEPHAQPERLFRWNVPPNIPGDSDDETTHDD